MIDKVTPQGINSDADSRVRPSSQMIDALNIAFEQSFKDSVAGAQTSDYSGDFTSLKPMTSNQSIEDIYDLDLQDQVLDETQIRVIGSVSDDIFNLIFFFVWSDDPNQMGVWAWDQEGLLPGSLGPGRYIKVYCSEKFNFPSDGFVKGDVVHIGQRESFNPELRNASLERRSADAGNFDDGGYNPGDVEEPPSYIDQNDRLDRVRNILLYFTDNRNEPKKLDVFKVMSMPLQALYQDYNNDDLLDLICACPRTPQTPITFVFDFDNDRPSSNFINLPGMQFAYQYVYDDNVESAISAYSKIAIPPAYIQMGAATGSPFLQNRCRLLVSRGTREVKHIRLLVRYGNAGSFRTIDVLRNINGNSPLFDNASPTILYDFYNDRVLVPVSQEEQNAQYSNLPRVAQAQTIVSDRLIYGNYLENYPEIATSCESEVIYGGTPEAGYAIELKVTPFIVAPDNYNNQATVSTVGNSRVAGCYIDLSGVPNGALGGGSIMNVSWSMMPDDNFHIYNHHKSYHGTSERYFGNNDVGNYDPASNNESADVLWNNGEYDPEMYDFYREGRSTFGKNKGVRFLDGAGGEDDFNKWKYQRPDFNNPGSFIQEEVPCVYGTSAANPLILKGEGLYFELTVQTMWAISDNPQDYIKNGLYSLLTNTPSMMPMQNGIPLLQTVGDSSQVEYVQNIDLGLNGNVQSIGVTSENNDERKNLICSLLDANVDNPEHQEPIGYFIVNEATATWGLTAHPDMEGLGGEDNAGLFLGLNLKSLTNIDVRTCIPNVPWDHGGYNIGIPNSSATEYHIENSGENDEDWGNLFFNLGNPSTNVKVQGWMPPQIMNCTVTEWKTFNNNYLNGSDPTNIVGNAPWDNLGYPYNSTQVSKVGHKNLLFAQPQNIAVFLELFQQDEGAGVTNNYTPSVSTDTMGSVAFPCMSEGLNRYKTIGVLTGPSGDTNITSLIDSPSRVSNHYGDLNCMFSLVDGEGNMGHSEHGGAFDLTGLSTIDLELLNQIDSTLGSVLPVQVFTGQITPQPIVSGGIAQGVSAMAALGFRATPLKHLRTPVYPGSGISEQGPAAAFPSPSQITNENWLWDAPGSQGSIGIYYLGNAWEYYDDLSSYGGNGTANNNWVEIVSENSTVALAGGEYYHRSFKTRAHHEFGIVYYDQRGRSGHVNYLTNAYVKGYSAIERPAQLKGRVDIMLTLFHFPPRWATHYQIVYGGNSTIGDFVQYTTGLAFVENLDSNESIVTTGSAYDTPVDSDDAIIYVSLGYLQGENNASYSHAFGAMRKDGSKDLYTYSEGDKLRIKQYTDQDGVVQYPDSNKYEFEVIGVKTMTSNADENIIHDGTGIVPMHKTGSFLMLKSNPMAIGFRYVDVNGDMPMLGGDYVAQHHNWNNRCIVEIYSPKSVRDFDDRLYYEVGEKYDIVLNENGVKIHSQNNILLKDGDVYWRNIPVNECIRNTNDNLFYSIIQGTSEHDGNTSKPRFRNYFLETDTFTDTIPEADGKDWGKVKVIVPKAQTLYKRSSVCFSDKNNYSAKRNSYTMFNGSKFNHKDLPNEYGSINYILNDYDSLFVIQEDKASTIPVSRSILSTAGGQESLIAADKILGTQKYYQGDYGTDGNPESVVRAEENIYWASKSRREVYKWSRSKAIKVISNVGMKAYFNNIFKRALEDQEMGEGQVRVVGGYDSLRDEFIISIHNMYDFSDDEGFYDFEYDGEYIEIEDNGDGDDGDGNGGGGGGDPDVEDPVEPEGPDEPIKECPELTFSSFTSGSLSEMQPGDQATVTLTIQNTSSVVANLSNADIYPIPNHITSIDGINSLPLGLPSGGSISFVFNITIPNNYNTGIYTYNTAFHYDGKNDDCPKESIEFPIELEVDKPPRPEDPDGGSGGGGDPDVDEPGGDIKDPADGKKDNLSDDPKIIFNTDEESKLFVKKIENESNYIL